MTHWDAPESRAAWSLQTQFGTNIYLQPGEVGNELELWDRGFDNPEDYEAHHLNGSYTAWTGKSCPPLPW